MLSENMKTNMDKICRSCMSENLQMKSLFDNTRLNGDEHSLIFANMMMECASIQICNGDGLPECLCESCEMKLVVAYEFRRQCEKSDTTLRQIANITLQKNENIIPALNNENSDDNEEATVEYSDVENDEYTPEKENDLKCKYCAKVLRTKKGLKVHERSHANDNFVSCTICEIKIAPDKYEDHVKAHMEKSGDFKLACNECGLNFAKAYHLVKHKKMHKTETIIIKREDEMETGEEEEEVEIKDAKVACKYQCEECHKILTTYEGLKFHMRKHTGEKLYPCTVCNKSFIKSSHLKRHVRSMHDADFELPVPEKSPEKKVMECEFCDRKFKYKKSFNHHMQTEHGMENDNDSDTPLIELIAPEELTVEIDCNNKEDEKDEQSDPAYEPEEESKAPTKKNSHHTCHVCGTVFSRSNHLTRHMTLHRDLLNFKCNQCDKAYASQEYLDKHNKEDHVNKPYTCTICNRTFTRGEHLIRHLKVHMPDDKNSKSLKCSVCMKEFSRSDHLARHIKIHLQQDKRHVCNECGKAFNRLDNLKTHQRIHTGQRDNSKLHLCIYCGKEFNNSSNMIVHMRRHTGERPYKCSQCNKGFPRSHDLKCHERTHSGEKPYLCTLCGKSFNKSNKLLRHSRVHTGERPYVCNLCGRGFTQSNDLALHMRRHTGSRPYACGVCPARFIQSGQLKSHRKSTGHWMETQPDLKGAHRVEPVVPLSEPTPIKFKTHGKPKQELEFEKEELREIQEGHAPTISLVGDINVQVPIEPLLVVEGTKILEQYSHLNNFSNTYVITEAARIKISEEQKENGSKDNPATFQTYAATSTTSTFNSATYDYQTYG